MAKPIVLIDAYSQIFRCFYAIAHLSNSRGEPTNALFAFTRLLLKLQQDFPEHDGALCFDCGKPAFRLELAPDYKAGRPPMPEDLARQMPQIRAVAAAFGWPLLQCENYEADDLIGGFAKATQDREVFIVSSDKDLAQLIAPGIHWLAPDRKNSGFEVRGAASVQEKYGVTPEQMVDYLALLGDNSDHISGVPGIGGKTAAKILQALPSLDAAADAPAGVISDKVRSLLQEHAGLIRRNRQLIALKTELPPEFRDHAAALQCRTPDWRSIAATCRDQELKRLLKELPDTGEPEENAADDPLFAFASQPVAAVPPPPAGTGEKIQDDLFG